MFSKSSKSKCILILKAMNDPKQRYLAAKKLVELWPETSFMDWKKQLDAGETIVLMRADNVNGLTKVKSQLESFKEFVEVVQQKSIGGKPVF